MSEKQTKKPNKIVVAVVIVLAVLFVLYGFYSRFLSKKESGIKSGELKPGKVVSEMYTGFTDTSFRISEA